MVDVFELVDGKIILKPEALLVDEFNAVWERDDSPSKDTALQEFKYMYMLHSHSPDNPFSSYSDADRIKKVNQAVKIKIDATVKSAIQKFIELRDESPYMRLLVAAKTALEKVTQYLLSVDLTLTDQNGKPIHDIKKVTDTIERTPTLAKSLKDLEEKVRTEEFEGRKTKAKRTINYFEE